MSRYTGHRDTFARDGLPPRDQWPDLINVGELGYAQRLNCAAELLDRVVDEGDGDRTALLATGTRWTYAELQDKVNRIARVLVDDLELITGDRVLLRAPNCPMLVACWFAVVKAGAIPVGTMPLLRSRELAAIGEKARVRVGLCDARLASELETARADIPGLEHVVLFGEDQELERRMLAKTPTFEAAATAADDVCLIAFTSGTTGKPKGTLHFHRDMLAICDTFSRHILRPVASDCFVGSPPIAFTFGLGGLVLFPMRVRAATVLVEQPTPDALAEAVREHHATVMFTAPTAYRAMLHELGDAELSGLRQCVSAGETLPLPTYEAWRERTGIRIIDGIGSTEMLHIFISAAGDEIHPGTTGKPVPLYEAKVIDDEGRTLPPGESGRLAVRGPTGCRYLADERQRDYVVDGWNLTGDAYEMDADGYFRFQARTDDMIISSGYNIAGPEVEDVLLDHAAVAECAVVGSPDDERGAIVKAFVVLKPGGRNPDDALALELQEHVKARIAPYKYPRAVEFVDGLPRTETGKLQRYRLRLLEMQRSGR